MSVDWVRLEMDTSTFEPSGFADVTERVLGSGVVVTPRAEPTSNRSDRGFVFNEMTGVLGDYRRRDIAISMKVHGMRFADRCGVSMVRTLHHPNNLAMIALNRRLGYVDGRWPFP